MNYCYIIKNSFLRERQTNKNMNTKELDYSHCDTCVKSVIEKFILRSDLGMKKYGTNLDRTDLSLLDWIQHAQEEHMDAILYLEKIKKEVQNKN